MHRSLRKTAIILSALLCSLSFLSQAQNKLQQKLPEKTRILFVLDASGSMEALWSSKESRMNAAKRILTRLVDSLRNTPNLELALRVYGHQFSRQANNCQDSKLEVPFAAKNHNTIISKIGSIKPKGVTPITFSLLQAAKDFPASPGYRNILILITDGVESCGGDPCAASLELQRKGVFLRPFIIGLGLQEGKALDCVGKYLDSQNATSFHQILNENIKTTFSKTTVSVELLNGSGKPVETNVDVSFINTATGVAAYEFVHYLDRQGKPDSVQIDPVLSYNIVVNTVPPVVKDANIINGSHNVITVSVPQGTLVMKPEGRGNPFEAVVREAGKSVILNRQMSNEPYRYLAGDYEVETLTLPRRIFQVKLQADQTETLTLPSPGVVNINTLSNGIGSLFEVLNTSETRWVCHLSDRTSQHSYNLLPGKYKIAFRARSAGGSKFTAIKYFEIKSGQSLSVNMFN
jgi:Ca-activated chloride channel family protein